MKNLHLTALFFMLITGCKKYDNYTAPDSGVYGKLIDAETGQTIETKQPGGGDVRFLQFDPSKYPSPQPMDIAVQANGSFSAARFFAARYKAFPWNGPFQYFGDSVEVVLNHGQQTELNFEVVPYYRIEASVSDSTFTYTITKPTSNTSKLIEVIFMVNNYPVVNENVSSNVAGPGTYYANLWKVSIDDSTPDEEVIGKAQIFTFNWADTHLPKGDYYFRVGARSSTSPASTYNYSPVIQATVH